MKYCFLFLSFLFAPFTFCQTFNGGGDIIQDYQTVNIPINVSLSATTIDTVNFGLETVCVNLTHTWLSDLTIEIVAPDGTTRTLATNVGGGDDNMIGTCFNQSASLNIQTGVAPFTGIFIPMGQVGAVNNGQNPNGTWYLRITDNYGQDEGAVQDWSITFGSQPATYFNFRESNLPIVVIETNGQLINNDVKIISDMGIIYNGPGIRNHLSDPRNAYNGKIGIEYRGNYSLSLPQKPYSIELVDEAGNNIDTMLLGMPAEHDWLLLANYNDKSFARNVLPFHLFDTMGHYSVKTKFVDVLLNGEYQGIYLLAEKIKRDSNRVDIAKLLAGDTLGIELSGGYILKVDYWDNTNSWQSNFSPIGYPGLDVHFVYTYPSPSEISLQQQHYIQNFMDEFETALYSSYFDNPIYGYRKYIHTESFIDYFIVNELARNVDGYKKSRFLFKDKDHPDGTYKKLHAGPVWDFDWAMKDMWWGSENGSEFMYDDIDQDINAPGWYIRLLEDTVFANELRCRYEDLRRTVLDLGYMVEKIDSVASIVHESQNWHFKQWGNLGVATGTPEIQAPSLSYSEEVQRLKDWLTRRINWLDENMPGTLSGCSMSGILEGEMINCSVSPNPFQSSLTITFLESTMERGIIRLLDAEGRIIRETILTQVSASHTLDDLASLKTGVYFLSVEIGNNKKVFKIVH